MDMLKSLLSNYQCGARSNRRALAALAACALLGPAPALAASRFSIKGAGFGHGVGMSQFGAYGYAKHGSNYQQILGHYYSGTAVSRLADDRLVRVLLKSSNGSLSFTGANRAGARKLSPAKTYSVARAGATSVRLRSPTRRTLAVLPGPLHVTGGGPLLLRGRAINGVTDGTYHGAFDFRPGTFGGIDAINVLGLESYVAGVVGGEVPASWPADALKAQAVAARTYTITTSAGASQGFDQYADTRSQAYHGVSAERPPIVAATSATRGEVVTYGGTPVVTYYFSTSGGRTENVENSFIGSHAQPWLRSVDDPYDDVSPRHRWGPTQMTLAHARALLHGMVKGDFRGIDVTRRGVSPRVVYADVVGSGGRTRVTGPELRKRLGLYDTWAYFTTIGSRVESHGPTGSDAPPASDPSGGTPPPSGATGTSGGSLAEARVASRTGGPRLRGSIVPAPAGSWLRVQRLSTRRHWVTVAWALADSHGRYKTTLPGHAVYRAFFRGTAGPAVHA